LSLARPRWLSPLVLFLTASVAPPQLFGDAMASVTVQTETGGQPGGSSCLLTSSGAEIQCASGKAGVPDLMRAAGSASAGVGSLSIFAAADGPGTFLARADANTS